MLENPYWWPDTVYSRRFQKKKTARQQEVYASGAYCLDQESPSQQGEKYIKLGEVKD